MTTRKSRGYQTQALVAEALATVWPYATSAGAGRPGTDVLGVPFDVEVKARRGLVMAELLAQLKARKQDNRLGVGVIRLDGQGPASLADWPVVMRFEDALDLLAYRYGANDDL